MYINITIYIFNKHVIILIIILSYCERVVILSNICTLLYGFWIPLWGWWVSRIFRESMVSVVVQVELGCHFSDDTHAQYITLWSWYSPVFYMYNHVYKFIRWMNYWITVCIDRWIFTNIWIYNYGCRTGYIIMCTTYYTQLCTHSAQLRVLLIYIYS